MKNSKSDQLIKVLAFVPAILAIMQSLILQNIVRTTFDLPYSKALSAICIGTTFIAYLISGITVVVIRYYHKKMQDKEDKET